MHNVLVLSFEGFSFSSRQLYQQLLPKLISRAVVHESNQAQDALNYILCGWPSSILVTDPFITLESEDSGRLLDALAEITKQGCITVFMGFFASSVNHSRLDYIFKHYFELRWRVGTEISGSTRLLTPDSSLIRIPSLVPLFHTKALYLSKVPIAQTIYSGSSGGTAYAAYGHVGLGKLGYIGDSNFEEESERLILAIFTIQTTTAPITVSPSKTALVIIDMQNFFLSESFGRSKGPGHAATEKLINYAIPAARKAGIRIIWLNWGLTDEDMETMPPAIQRAFGFATFAEDDEAANADPFAAQDAHVGADKFGNVKFEGGHVLLENGKDGRIYKGLGAQCGSVKLHPSGETLDAGRLLMKDSWNAALYPPLDALYEEGSRLSTNPDVWIHKNRMSGMWGPSTPCQEYLEKEGIRTLFFTGVNTDQCVGGTFADAFSKGYDCILLGDGCGTTSPEFAQQCWESNAARTFGFLTGCVEFAKGVENMA
ncbi:Isochorismatase hydrolase [Delitschia confertaspora ATCC 74209]|uniref:Isochorismatase hydrolase n=1 Tax=Delitschia confertaspora ATCC 74209 TaxID=1513339 RepID=A0A9P4JK22_9PLEO|nr:Isochorismatase hydrolase [Delitschia confertaspora ATCC 74209]